MLRLLHDMSGRELAGPATPNAIPAEPEPRCEASFPWAQEECPNCGETELDGQLVCEECAAELGDLEREIGGL